MARSAAGRKAALRRDGGTSGVRSPCAEPPRRHAARPPPLDAVEVETRSAVGTGATRAGPARRPHGSRVDTSRERAGGSRPLRVRRPVPGGRFHGEGRLCGPHQSRRRDATPEEAPTLKPGALALSPEKATQRRRELSGSAAPGRRRTLTPLQRPWREPVAQQQNGLLPGHTNFRLKNVTKCLSLKLGRTAVAAPVNGFVRTTRKAPNGLGFSFFQLSSHCFSLEPIKF